MNDNRPIGVFDSGVGGVTVLSKLVELFPNEEFIYVGDTLNCPYGIKSSEEIQNLVTNVTKFLLEQNVKAIVIACNTATCNSSHLSKLTNIPIIGVIEPTAKYALKTSQNKNIAVLATNATIDSHKYESYLEKRKIFKKGIRYYVKCSEFVTLVEEMKMNTDYSQDIVSTKLNELKNCNLDTVILGCTHFGLLSKEINQVLPNVKLIDCGKPTGLYLKKVLKKRKLLASDDKDGIVKIYTTGDADTMAQQIQWFDKDHQPIKKIIL